MENYKKMMKQKISSKATMLCLGSAVFIICQQGYLSKYKPDGDFGDFINGFQLGVFITFVFIGVYQVVRFLIALNNEDMLRQMYIKDNDERNIKISEMTGKRLQQSVCYPLLLASIIAGYFSAEVFFTILAVIIFISIITIARKIYFNKTI